MYARITKLAMYPEKIDEMLERLDEVKEQLGEIPGLQYWFTASDRESGEGVGIAIYDTKENAAAALPTAQTLLAGFGEYWLKPPEVEEYGVDGHLINA